MACVHRLTHGAQFLFFLRFWLWSSAKFQNRIIQSQMLSSSYRRARRTGVYIFVKAQCRETRIIQTCNVAFSSLVKSFITILSCVAAWESTNSRVGHLSDRGLWKLHLLSMWDILLWAERRISALFSNCCLILITCAFFFWVMIVQSATHFGIKTLLKSSILT